MIVCKANDFRCPQFLCVDIRYRAHKRKAKVAQKGQTALASIDGSRIARDASDSVGNKVQNAEVELLRVHLL